MDQGDQQSDQRWMQKATSDGVAPAAATSEAPPRTAGSGGGSFIGEAAQFEGALRTGPEGVRIDAEFRGKIVTEGTLVVSQSAAVEADIHAREVVIGGVVVGDVVASRQLVLRAGGRLQGDVETPCFELEKHAFFNGRSRMERPEVGLRTRSSQERSASKPEVQSAPPPSA